MAGVKGMWGSLRERFDDKVIKVPDGHWLWGGATSRDYGVIDDDDSQRVKAHRVSYELHTGAIPEGLVVRHKCGVKHCVNPEHLRIGTQADNMADERKDYCKYGHHIPTVGRNKNGNCRKCMCEYLKWYHGKPSEWPYPEVI